jgi:uncharacterized damage-inducible protein DinB
MFALRVLGTATALALISAGGATAQQRGGPMPASPTVAAALRYERGAARQLAQAAEDLPADKYSFKPTPAQWTFAEVVAHVADENDQSCDPILGRPAHPKEPTPADGKAALVAALRASFAKCDSAFLSVTEAQLTKQVTFYGSQSTIVNILFSCVGDWNDHYAQEAIYLRLNGILPPSAKQN